MYDGELLQELLKEEHNQILKRIIICFDSTEKFESLLAVREQVDKAAYAMYVRMAIQTDTHDVPLELLLKVLDGLKQEDLMSKEELEKLEQMPDVLTIYRGTDACEFPPRISWSLNKETARRFDSGQMYKAMINKKDIYGYFSCNGDKEEIIAHVTDNFDDIL